MGQQEPQLVSHALEAGLGGVGPPGLEADEGLGAAPLAAAAGRPLGVEGNMPDLPRVPVAAREGLVAQHQPAPQPGPQAQVDQVGRAPLAQGVHPQRGGVGLVLQGGRGLHAELVPLELVPQHRQQRQVAPAEVGGEGEVALGGLDQPRHRQAQPPQAHPRAGALQQAPGGLRQPVEAVAGVGLGPELQVLGVAHLPHQVLQPHGQVVHVDLPGRDQVPRAVELEGPRGPPHPAGHLLPFLQQPLAQQLGHHHRDGGLRQPQLPGQLRAREARLLPEGAQHQRAVEVAQDPRSRVGVGGSGANRHGPSSRAVVLGRGLKFET